MPKVLKNVMIESLNEALETTAFMMPPTPSIASEIPLAVGRLDVPLKHRCSMK